MMNKIYGLLLVLSVALLNSGCNPKVIDKVQFAVQPNLETARVEILFSNKIKPPVDVTGSFPIKKYGQLFVAAATPDTPFTVGFDLNMSIVNDQDYINYTPTTTLPSGDPIPGIINRALAQVQTVTPIGSKFDAYAYVDILGREWIGTAIMLNFIDENNFPSGLSISQTFLKDAQGNARAAAVVFGPKVDSNTGAILVPGGIAIFANVAALLKGNDTNGLDRGSLPTVMFHGTLLDSSNIDPVTARRVRRLL